MGQFIMAKKFDSTIRRFENGHCNGIAHLEPFSNLSEIRCYRIKDNDYKIVTIFKNKKWKIFKNTFKEKYPSFIELKEYAKNILNVQNEV